MRSLRQLRIESLERRQLLAGQIQAFHPATSEDAVWSELSVAEPVVLGPQESTIGKAAPAPVSYLRATDFNTYTVNHAELSSRLRMPEATLSIPTPEGTFESFRISESSVMAPELAAKFPQIQTYAGTSLDGGATLRLDLSPTGLFAQVLSSTGDYYVDPYYHLEDQFYASYYSSGEFVVPEFIEPYLEFAAEDDGTTLRERVAISEKGAQKASGAELRTYRTAVAATGEYTTFHGGTVAGGLAAIVTAINRVTGIYEQELSIRLELIANNDLIVYTDAATDPYTNTISGTELQANHDNLTSVIGGSNYDIGHLLSTDGGGLAGLGVVGDSNFKGRGTTGLSSPTGDYFYVDLLSHEIGHQFGGSHTFNGDSGSCATNRSGSAAFEPGSGSTIQAYAGICGDDNLQSRSDAQFHSYSHEQIIQYVDVVIPGVGTRTATGNSIPTVDAGLDYVIPAATPFALTAQGSDADVGDVLTYSWEQRDLGPQQDVNAGDNGSSPLFRVFTPTTDPTRTFPRLTDLLANTTVTGETLPTTNRELNFNVTVRDNRAGGGAIDSDNMKIDVVDTGSPFRVTSFNAGGSLPALSTQTVTWDVGGTTGNGINTPNVNVLLSTDGGLTYPITLAAKVANDGSHDIVLPLVSTAGARIKVEGDQNIFFDVNDQDITIAPPEFASDFGDAPDLIYQTLSLSGGAEHTDAGSDVFLGSTIDRESNGQSSADATGDGIDEDGIVFHAPLVAGTTADMEVTASAAGVLDFFFDFDGAGAFGNNANEVFSAAVTAGTQTIAVPIPASAVPETFARFRISEAGGLGPAGVASGGEVEDYRFEIFATDPEVDFADSPEPLYATLLANDGPRHIARGPRLGLTVDGESDGQPNATATGDGNDEDGINFAELLIPNTTANVEVRTPSGGELDYFFDFDADGVFGNNPDEIFRATLSGGLETVPVFVPASAVTGLTRARFRLSTAGGLTATGFAPDGEVEDYQVLIIAPGSEGSLISDFDGVTAPALPAGWSAFGGWVTNDGDSSSAPNHAFNAFAANANDSLEAPATLVETPRLRFRNSYDIDDVFHGAVLELSIDGGPFNDIIDAGGSFVSGGYNGTVSNSFGNPLGNRDAWTGNSGGYVDAVINLPPAAIGESVVFRWRAGTDNLATAGLGWRIDDVELVDDGVLRFDYGDAADPSFPTLDASDGAAHRVSPLTLGATVDVDGDGQPTATADGDDVGDGNDDEDGVTLPAELAVGVQASVTVNASDDGLLNAWVDFDDSGTWELEEQIFRDVVVVAGDNVLLFDVPGDAAVTPDAATRFRLSRQSALAPHGKAPDGEVEDLAIAITAAAPQVESIVINGGEAQRSSVYELQVTFDRVVVIGGSPGQAFDFLNVTTAIGVLGLPSVATVDGKTVVTFAFEPGASVNAAGILNDGDYRLTINSDFVSAGGVMLDGDGVGGAGGNHVFDATDGFFRLYGDGDGNGSVNLFDFVGFRSTYLVDNADPLYRAEFDSNADDMINLFDFVAFRGNYGP